MAKQISSILGGVKTRIGKKPGDKPPKPDEEETTGNGEGEEETAEEEETTEGEGEEETAEEEEETAEEEETEEAGGKKITVTEAELDSMIDRRLADRQRTNDREKRKQDRKEAASKAKNDKDYQALYQAEVDDHEDTQEELENLRNDLAIQRARNDAISYAMASHPDVAGDVDEWVMPRIEQRMRAGLDETELKRTIKQEVKIYADRFKQNVNKVRQRSGGTPGGTVRGRVDPSTQQRIRTMTPAPPKSEEADEEEISGAIRSGW